MAPKPVIPLAQVLLFHGEQFNVESVGDLKSFMGVSFG